MPADLTQDILNSDVITLLTRAIPNPELIEDETAEEPDKILTVDANEIWEILWIYLELTSSATVGNRMLRFSIRDDSNDIIWSEKTGIDQPANQTYTYILAPGQQRNITNANNISYYNLPATTLLPAAYNIRLFENNSIDGDDDGLIIHMMINRYDV